MPNLNPISNRAGSGSAPHPLVEIIIIIIYIINILDRKYGHFFLLKKYGYLVSFGEIFLDIF